MRETDYQFVFETTVKVRWPRRNSIPWGEWKMMHGPMVDRWMRDGQALVAESSGVLLGFVVLAPTGVAMLYVKRGFRGEGIGMRLLGAIILADSTDRIATNRCVDSRGRGARLVIAMMPTPSWQRWCERSGVKWERAAC